MGIRNHRRLAAVSAAQLAVGLTGLRVALRRGHVWDLQLIRGNPDNLRRDAVWLGTALSAPGPMLAAQMVGTAVLARRPDRRATRIVGALGAAMVGGYLVERLGRLRLRPGSTDPVETPIVVAGTGLAAVMAVLGWHGRNG